MNNLKNAADKFCIIPLWDRCMLLIMGILLLECGYIALFSTAGSTQDTAIDVVLRAAISSLFGYFLSANFLNSQRLKQQQTFTDFNITNSPPIRISSPPTAPVPETATDEMLSVNDIESPPPGDEQQNSEIRDCHWIMRIKIVTSICIFSIVMLIVIRNVPSEQNATQPFISMFANMTSGSLGYLIGYLPYKNNTI